MAKHCRSKGSRPLGGVRWPGAQSQAPLGGQWADAGNSHYLILSVLLSFPHTLPVIHSFRGQFSLLKIVVKRTWASLMVQTVKNLPAMQETRFDRWVGKIPWRRKWLPTPAFLPGEPMDREPGQLQPIGSPRVGHD